MKVNKQVLKTVPEKVKISFTGIMIQSQKQQNIKTMPSQQIHVESKTTEECCSNAISDFQLQLGSWVKVQAFVTI